MSGAVVIFYLLAALVLGSGLLAVTSRQLFRSAIYLLFSLIGIAGLFFWMEYEFVAAVQIVVYVGGIVVLIIFSIFLTQSAGEKLPPPKGSRQLFAGLATFADWRLRSCRYSNIRICPPMLIRRPPRWPISGIGC